MQAVVDITQCAAEDEGDADPRGAVPAADASQKNPEDDNRNNREADQDGAAEMRTGLGKEAERDPRILRADDVEEVGDDMFGVREAHSRFDDVLGPAIEREYGKRQHQGKPWRDAATTVVELKLSHSGSHGWPRNKPRTPSGVGDRSRCLRCTS